ncbi:MAG: M14 family zinc carboxypeptidase [Bacteroidota bacterium]
MKKIILLLLILPIQLLGQVRLKYAQNLSLTYEEIVSAYQQLAATYPNQCKLEVAGKGDNGREIYTLEIFPVNKAAENVTLLINNGIHAGEPDGIDASIEFAEQVLKGTLRYPNTRIVIIPVYNVDGNSVQSCCTRANQNGPLNQGFRANSRNLDLNRDFMKADAENTRAFFRIFHRYKPHLLIDNHVSNGADYQYTMTLISTQADKLGTVLGPFLKNEFEPQVYDEMKKKGTPLVPYVNTIAEIPDSGLAGFLETPRFATGYAALFNCIGFVPETHMLKPYASRVVATRKLMETMSSYIDQNATRLIALKKRADLNDRNRKIFPVNWKFDKSRSTTIPFMGYEAGYKPSGVSGQPRLYYDRNRPFTRRIPYYNRFTPADSITKPAAYLIPQAWKQVISRLELNGVKYSRLEKDTVITVQASYISQFQTSGRPYEGHYLHSATSRTTKRMEQQFFKGDYLISTDQPAVRFLVEALSPEAADSYFNWNFFDSMLQQKEYFSDYVFEDTAAELLENDPALREKLEQKRKSDAAFSTNGQAQLDFIYRNSPYFEKTFQLYPVFQLP